MGEQGTRVRAGRQRVRIGAPDASLTPVAGLAAVTELVDRLRLVEELDAGIGPVKERDRGLTAGQFLVALVCCQMTGGDFLVSLDRCRADRVAHALGPVVTPPSTTAATLAKRIDAGRRAGIETAIAAVTARMVTLLPPRRAARMLGRPTIDIDATEVEVYGRAKAGVAYNYLGQRAARPHLATWAEAGVVLAADLLDGRTDPRAGAPALLARAVAALPAQAGRPRMRADTGYFAVDIARAALGAGCDFSIGVTRNPAAWRAVTALSADAWTSARGMLGAQVAACNYVPGSWPPGTRCVVRRVRHDAAEIGADPRARRRRTIPSDQLALALDGQIDEVYAYSFIVTNLPVDTPDQVRDLEAWHRSRTDIEDRIRDAKHGAALRHLPSGHPDVNAAWMWAALLATNLSAWLHELADLADLADDNGRGRAHLPRLRRELVCIPGRLVHHARGLTLRLPPGPQLLPSVLDRLRALPLPG